MAFFYNLEMRTKPFRSKLVNLGIQVLSKLFGKVMPLHTPESPVTMTQLMRDFCFPARVHANPYVSSTWCGDSQNLVEHNFAKWGMSITQPVIAQPGCYPDYEWVVCGGKYSKNKNNSLTNPSSVAWRDVKMLCFLYIHYDISDYFDNDWMEPKQYANDFVQRMESKGIGPNGVISKELRLWKAFPGANHSLDRDRKYYFESEEDYERVLRVKDRMDPNNIFTPNLFCVPVSLTPYF